MLALSVLVLLFVVLRSVRLPDWIALVLAVGGAIAARPYLPGLHLGASPQTIAMALVGLALVPYWLGPIIVHATQRSSASPSFVPYDPARHVVPPSIGVALQESATAVSGAGFTSVGDFFQAGFIENVTSRVSLFEKVAARQQAIVVGLYVNTEPTRLIAHYVEIVASFKDGRTLLVNNSPSPGAYAPVAGKTVEQFPDVRDPRRLVRLHDRLLASMGSRGSLKEIDRGSDAAAYLSAALVRELEQQVPTGYLRLDRAANAYRPTVKGAMLMTWAQLPPMSTVRKARVRRRAAALIAGLGVTEPDASPASVPSLQRKVAWPAVGLLMLLVGYAASAETRTPGAFEPVALAPLPVPADFTVPADFPGAVKALEKLTGAVAEQLTVTDSLGFPARTNGATVGVQAEQVDALLVKAQPLFLEKGFFLFRHEPNYGIGGTPDEIALVPVRDQLAIVSLVGTNGANYDLTTKAIVAWLRDLEKDAPFVLIGIGYDHVEGRFVSPVSADADALAKRLHAFCPDVVDQGTGSVRELANEIGRLNTFFCWWD